MKLVDPDILERFRKLRFARVNEISPEMVQRMHEMNVPDQCFLQLAMDEDLTRRDIARIIGCDAGTVTRRLRMLNRRLQSPLVIALFERRLSLPEDYREIGLDYFLRGRNTREIAELRNVTRFQVQQLVHFMQSWFSGLCANPRVSPRRSNGAILAPAMMIA